MANTLLRRKGLTFETLGDHPKPANDYERSGHSSRRIRSVGMSNVLNEEKKQQVIALGKLGWTLRRIEQATGVRRETISSYLKAAGVAIRQPGGWGRRVPAKPANGVITDSPDSKPANEAGVITDFIRPFSKKQPLALPPANPSVSSCEPYRETIEQGLNQGRNAM